MNEEQIALLFGLFAGDSVLATDYMAVIQMATQEVRQALLPAADETDSRLPFFAAAVAFLRYTEITAARDRVACTFAGTVAQNTDGAQKLAFAKELVRVYQTACRSLLQDETFWFTAV